MEGNSPAARHEGLVGVALTKLTLKVRQEKGDWSDRKVSYDLAREEWGQVSVKGSVIRFHGETDCRHSR